MEILTISNKIRGICKKSAPEILSGAGVVGMIYSNIFTYGKSRLNMLNVLYRRTGNKKYLVRYLQLTKSNNWLRMHGYPTNRTQK